MSRTLGKRYIDCVSRVIDLPINTPDGSMCYVEENETMYTKIDERWYNRNQFYYVKALGVECDENWTPVANMLVPSLLAGVYMIGFAVAYAFAANNQSAFFRWRVDGSDWYEVQYESVDPTDKIAYSYQYPDELGAGLHDFEFQARSEVSGTPVNIEFCDLWMQRMD